MNETQYIRESALQVANSVQESIIRAQEMTASLAVSHITELLSLLESQSNIVQEALDEARSLHTQNTQLQARIDDMVNVEVDFVFEDSSEDSSEVDSLNETISSLKRTVRGLKSKLRRRDAQIEELNTQLDGFTSRAIDEATALWSN